MLNPNKFKLFRGAKNLTAKVIPMLNRTFAGFHGLFIGGNESVYCGKIHKNQSLDCSKGGAGHDHLSMLFRSFAVYIKLKLMTFSLVLTGEPSCVKEHCCAEMSEQANMAFPYSKGPLHGSTDKRIYWSPVFNEYGLICQPSAEVLQIHHCPFCGFQLPVSRGDEWFETLEKGGWRTWGDPIPSELLAHDWK